MGPEYDARRNPVRGCGIEGASAVMVKEKPTHLLAGVASMGLRLKPLRKQTIVITGATSGIGLATARAASRRGAKLVLAARHETALQALTEELHQNDRDALAVVTDVTKEEDLQRLASMAIEHFGGFDTWINNAGVTIYGAITQVST